MTDGDQGFNGWDHRDCHDLTVEDRIIVYRAWLLPLLAILF